MYVCIYIYICIYIYMYIYIYIHMCVYRFLVCGLLVLGLVLSDKQQTYQCEMGSALYSYYIVMSTSMISSPFRCL